jgi:TldD protein
MTDARAATVATLRERFDYLRDVVAEMEQALPYASALARSGEGLRLALRDGDRTAFRLDPQSGVVLTVSNGFSLEEAATDRTDPVSVRALARKLVARARANRPLPGAEPLELVAGELADADHATPVVDDPGSLGLDEKLARVDAIRVRLRGSDSHVVQGLANYAEYRADQVFASRGHLVTQRLLRTHLVAAVVVSDGQRQQLGFVATGGTGGLERIDVADEQLAEVAGTAVRLLDARPVPPGLHDVVTDPSTSGIVAHEAFGHGVETDMFLKRRARAAEYVGRRVGSDLVTIIDDPSLDGGYGSYFVDDEGQVARPTTIVREGVMEGGITDLYSASRLGIRRTANGRRESVSRKAYARMSNTFFAPRAATRDELLASLDEGLEICQASDGMEDPKGWGIQVSARYARQVRHGRPTGVLYAPVAISGYVPDVLTSVSMVSRELAFQPGTCGKGWKEYVPVSSGGPYLRMRLRLG